MRFRHVLPLLVAAFIGTGCDTENPTEVTARKVAPQAFLTDAQIMRLTGTRQIGGTTIRTYAENFTETGVPCNEEVTIKGSNFFTSFYSEPSGSAKLTVLITSLGSGKGNPSGASYWKFYVNFQSDLTSFTTPEKDFTLIQKFRIERVGETVANDNAVGDVYHRMRVNALGEILEHTETSNVRCE